MDNLRKIEDILKTKELNYKKKEHLQDEITRLKCDFNFNLKSNLYMLFFLFFSFILLLLFPEITVIVLIAPILLISVSFHKLFVGTITPNYWGNSVTLGSLFYVLSLISFWVYLDFIFEIEKHMVIKSSFEILASHTFISLTLFVLAFIIGVFNFLHDKLKLEKTINKKIKDNKNNILKLKNIILKDDNNNNFILALFRNIEDYNEIEYLEANANLANLILVSNELSFMKKKLIETKGFRNQNEYVVYKREEENLKIKNI